MDISISSELTLQSFKLKWNIWKLNDIAESNFFFKRSFLYLRDELNLQIFSNPFPLQQDTLQEPFH